MSKLLFIAGTHGNEPIGVEALRDIEKKYNPSDYNYDWIIGNPRAFEAGVRFIDTDLNRSAPGNPNSDSYEERRAAKILNLSKQYGAVIDIHGTIADCGIATIIPYPTIENIDLAKAIPLARNVIWYAAESAISGPLVQHTSCPAVEIECGPKDVTDIREQLKVVLGKILLANVGQLSNAVQQSFYEVYGEDTGGYYEDFYLARNGDEEFFPFLSYEYDGTSCQKMRLVNPTEVML